MPKSSRFGLKLSVWIAAGMIAVTGLAVGATTAYAPTPEAAPPGAYPAMPKPDTAGMSAQQIALVQRGEYLTTAADCMPCHTSPGAKPFAGGLSFVTPFGTLYSPNITPDKTNGIGTWSGEQFWDAVHSGIIPGKSLLVFPNYVYPAMPYTSYSKLSRPDVMAIKAYLDAIPAVSSPHAQNDLTFPFNIRAMLLGWRIMFFRPHPVHYAASWSPAVRNGAYLAEALGHCTECHSPRNILFAIKSGDSLAGAQILGEPWYAPNISSSKQYGVGGWSRDDLVSYLREGGNMTYGSAFGPMKSVVDASLSQIPKSDVDDLAAYLQTATAPRDNAPKAVTVPASELAEGKTLYAQNCAACHQTDGKGIANVFPNLAGNQSAWGGAPDNVIGIVLGGMVPWHANGPAMPAFGSILNDHQIANVTNYIRTAWGNPGVPDATAATAFGFRKSAPPHKIALADADYLDLQPIASADARKLGCPLLNNPLIDPTDAMTQIMQGATSDTMASQTQALVAAIKKSNPDLTKSEMQQYMLTVYCPVVATQPGLSLSDKKAALKRFMDQAPSQAMNTLPPATKQGS
ncbi:MAG: cytochrome c [Acidiphilium sp.]|nr:cytochrome c [Acidiphilium sp.]MDD4934493.1 cytochrome c [Acidiphilium sp.]